MRDGYSPVRSPRGRSYLSEFSLLLGSEKLVSLGLLDDGKEISESMAGRTAALSVYRADDPDVVAICVGDGVFPRTAALLATTTAWTCHSVDPLMRWEDGRGFERLHVHQSRAEDLKIECPPSAKVMILAIHAHVRLRRALRCVSGARTASIVAIPCCIRLDVPGVVPDEEYEDHACLSVQRTVKIWREVPVSLGMPSGA